MINVAVFCSSSNLIPEKYKEQAKDLGAKLAKEDIRLIYGAGKVGLMGIVGEEFTKAGKPKTGIIPEILKSVEVASDNDTEQIITQTMQERKHLLIEKSDVFIILPGGIGTLDEFFEVLTMRQIGLLGNKKIIIANWFGFFDNMINQLELMSEEKFTKFEKSWFTILSDNDEITNTII